MGGGKQQAVGFDILNVQQRQFGIGYPADGAEHLVPYPPRAADRGVDHRDNRVEFVSYRHGQIPMRQRPNKFFMVLSGPVRQSRHKLALNDVGRYRLLIDPLSAGLKRRLQVARRRR